MLQRSIAISLGTASIVGTGGLIGAYLSGGFDDTYPIRRVVWNSKPISLPEIDSSSKQIKDVSLRNTWAKRELEFLNKASGKVNHPWWTELLKVRGNDELNIPVLIAKWCMNNNDSTVDVTTPRGQMLEKLCDVSLR